MTGLFDIFDVLYKLLPAWMVYVLFVVIFLAILPSWYQWVRKKQIKGNIRAFASTSDPTEKSRLHQQLRARVGQRPKALKMVALLAHEMGAVVLQKEAEQQLMERGESLPTYPIKDKRPEGPGRLHPIEVAARIRQLLEQNLPDAATNMLDEALARNPDDPDLVEAQHAIHAYLSTSDNMPQSHSPSTSNDA